MVMKKFHELWTTSEINSYTECFGVLVLFDMNVLYTNNEAKIIIHGELTDDQRYALLEGITNSFGGQLLTDDVCDDINKFAEKWYNRYVLNRRARVINIKRKDDA